MSRATRTIAGLILITVPTIEYGGLFLLSSLVDPQSGYAANALRQDLFRAGHAHAGVITILSLLCQVLADGAALPAAFLWLARLGVPVSGILISALLPLHARARCDGAEQGPCPRLRRRAAAGGQPGEPRGGPAPQEITDATVSPEPT